MSQMEVQALSPPRATHGLLGPVAVWAVAFAAALVTDAPVARWARSSGTSAAVAGSRWTAWVKGPGTFWFTAAVVFLLWTMRRIDWRRVVFIVVVAALAGLNVIPKWIVGRTRPYKLPISLLDQPRPFELHPCWHGLRGLFHQVNLSFPSGHACTAFALAAAVRIAWRPGGAPLLVLATAVGVERVVENAHYVSDVVGAVGFAGLGAIVARAAMWTWVQRRPGPPGFPVRLLAEESPA